MLTFSYKIADGGLSNSRFEQANARLLQAQLRDVDARETLELDIRQQYLQFNSTRSKRAGLVEGVKASTSARELYKEQFRGGKRTLLELLEIQNAYYTARYNEIVNGSDLLVAGYGILRSTGQLTNQLLNQR
jgi:outer membrane protein TolC